MFNHEKLNVYQKSLDFVAKTNAILESIKRKPPAVDHIKRASMSVPLNIAQGNGDLSRKRRVHYLNIAYGSALECAACLDLLVGLSLVTDAAAQTWKSDLSQICAMLHGLKNVDVSKFGVGEEEAPYVIDDSVPLFSHEKLEVYQTALRVGIAVDLALVDIASDSPVRQSLLKSTTGAVLNIAEGNGRFAAKDRINFLKTAHFHTLKAAATLDVWSRQQEVPRTLFVELKGDTERVCAMLIGLIRSIFSREC